MIWLAVYLPQGALQYQRFCHGIAIEIPMAFYDPQQLTILAVDTVDVSVDASIEVGLSVATAQALCANLVLIEYQPSLSEQYIDWLAKWSYNYSARVVVPHCELQSKQSGLLRKVPDVLLLEVGSMAQIFSGVANLLRQYAKQASDYGFRWQMQLAEHPLVAQLLAVYQPQLTYLSESGSLQEGAYQLSEASTHQETLAELPISALPVENAVMVRCQQMGVTSIGKLLALPHGELGKRFGEALLMRLGQLQGRIEMPQCFYVPAETYQQKLSLMYDVEHIEGILFPLSRMLAQLSDYLVQRQLAILQLQLTLVYRSHEFAPLLLTIHYPFAEHRSDNLLALCRLQLERQTLYSPLVALQLDVDDFVSQQIDESSWWQEQGITTEIRQLFATLEARLGEGCVKSLRLANHHLPESSYQLKPLTEWGQTRHQHTLSDLSHKTAGVFYHRLAAEGAAINGALGLFRPSFLLPTPQKVTSKEITRLKGPERISPPWWLAQADRDYYVAAHCDGGLCWVFYDGQANYIQGWFS
ncbi:Y-family DNA polymerase [Shewanella waksmanii]|uniref:Y-family DNA polymerase n=1 Tax=Shewanella waksmanii TaxID=213783 RepID=UPI003736B123